MTGEDAVHDEVGDRDRGRGRQHDRRRAATRSAPARRCTSRRPRRVAARRRGTSGVTPCSANAAHMRSWSGCDSGFPSTGRAPIIAMRTSAAPNAASCASNHAGSRSVRCATGCSRPFPSARTTAHHRFHAPMLAVSAGSDVGQRALPQQPEVREQHRFVEPHGVEARHAGRRFPVVGGQRLVVRVLGRQPVAETHPVPAHLVRCRAGAARRRARASGRASTPTSSRARRRRPRGRRRRAPGRCGRATWSATRRGAGRSR